MGKDQPTVYALEGSVAVGGAALRWLQNQLGMLKNTEESELVSHPIMKAIKFVSSWNINGSHFILQLASSVYSTGDVYFVPAFNGLYAPYCKKDAKG